jgi:hypothetical protein
MEKSSLLPFTLASRRLSAIARTALHSHVSLRLDSLEENTPASRRFFRFYRHIQESKNTRYMVHSLDFQWVAIGMIDQARSLITNMLEKLTSLQRISITAYGDSISFQLSLFGQNKLENLSYAEIDSAYLNPATVMNLMRLKRIKCIEIVRSDMKGSLGSTLQHSSPLTTLDLGEICLPKNTLRSLLEMTKELKMLECGVPNGEQLQVANRRGYIQNNLSPAEILSAILPVQQTLRKLVLCDVYQNYWPIHDGSRLDLSGFTALKTIKVPSNLLFQAAEADPSRDGVYRLLPRSLEWIKVGRIPDSRA